MGAATCIQPAAKCAPGTTVYRRRLPEHSVVYQVIKNHLETWLAGCRQANEEDSSVAVYIEQDFRNYLECGNCAYGFARCLDCGHDFLSVFLQRARQLPLMHHTAHGRNCRTPDRSYFPMAAGTAIGALGAQTPALLFTQRSQGTQYRAADFSARDPH
jgi:hypothetical protein